MQNLLDRVEGLSLYHKDLPSLFRQRMTPDVKSKLKEILVRKLRIKGNFEREEVILTTFSELRLLQADIIDEELVSLVFRKMADIELCSASLRLIDQTIAPYSLSRQETGDIRRAVVFWLDNIAPKPSQQFVDNASDQALFCETLRLALEIGRAHV